MRPTLFILFILFSLIGGMLSHAHAGAVSCYQSLQYSHPEWRYQDLDYVCTARHQMQADSNSQYSACVQNLAMTSADGEFIINACLNGNVSPGSGRSCKEGLSRIHPEFREADLKYICTARYRFALDSNPAFSMCVQNRSMTSADGEFIINSCLNSDPNSPPPTRSCREQLSSIHPEWRDADLNYICTARHRMTADSDLRYTACVANQARYSANGEFIINSCVGGGGANPQPNPQPQPPLPQPQPQPRLCLCTLSSQWGNFRAQAQSCDVARDSVINQCANSNPHAVCSGSQVSCR